MTDDIARLEYSGCSPMVKYGRIIPGTDEIIKYPRGERVEVDCAQFAKFEARPIMPAPERDMRETVEEWDA